MASYSRVKTPPPFLEKLHGRFPEKSAGGTISQYPKKPTARKNGRPKKYPRLILV
jgi:hypothetical protein